MSDKPKQIIVMRKDLGMRKGKIAAQAAHASMAVLLNMMDKGFGTDTTQGWMLRTPVGSCLSEWLNGSFTKICVYVNSEQELLDVAAAAEEAGLSNAIIMDNGLTEFHGVPTITCAAIGPAYPDELQPVTGHLPLF